MKNLLLTLLLFMSGLAYSQTVITDTINQCQGDTITLTYTYPSTGPGGLFWNCDSITDAHMFLVNIPQNPNDSIQTWWDINWTWIVVEPISFMFPPHTFTESGCYQFNVVLTCISGGTITLTSTWYVSTVGIEELTLERKVIKITDMMGKECLPQTNKLLIYHYSDNSTDKVFVSEI